MADLEDYVFKRDKRFLVRLVLGVGIGFVAGFIVAAKLTDRSVGACAARSYQTVTQPTK
jgi:hypothetical protein